jgi:hypothetical protein
LSGFLDSNVGKLRLKIVSVQVVPPQVAQMKTWRKFTKSLTETDEVPFQRSLANRPHVWNIPVNSNGGLKHVTDLCKVCALVAHQRAEAVVCVCQELFDEVRNDQNFLLGVITGDKTWL